MRFVLMALTALAPGREYAVGGSRLAKLEGISQDGRGRFRLALRDEAPNIASNPPFQGRSGSLNEHGAPSRVAPCRFRCRGWLQLHDVLSRRAFLRLHDLELHALPFGQRLEPLTLNSGVMHEAVLTAVFGRDETEALGVVEPLHGTGDACHLCVTPG